MCSFQLLLFLVNLRDPCMFQKGSSNHNMFHERDFGSESLGDSGGWAIHLERHFGGYDVAGAQPRLLRGRRSSFGG